MTRDEKNTKNRYLKVVITTVVVAGAIFGAIFGAIRDRDRIDFDIQKLKRSIGIANALHFQVSIDAGLIVMKRRGVKASREVEIPTLKDAIFNDNTVQVRFKSLLFSKTITLDRTFALQLE